MFSVFDGVIVRWLEFITASNLYAKVGLYWSLLEYQPDVELISPCLPCPGCYLMKLELYND